jgi:putative membrane protein
MKQTVGVALAVLALAAAPAFAQTGQSGQGSTAGQATTAGTTGQTKSGQTKSAQTKAGTSGVSAADQAFVKEAAAGGMAEVEFGNLAKQNAASADVKQFGDRMVTDHGKANDELKQWASQKNVTLPTELDAKHKATHDRLAKLNGAAFDKAYMQDMVTDHKQDVAKFRKESTSAHDADLKAWAGKTLPTLEDHLKMAQDTASKVGAASAGASKSKGATKSKSGKGK